MELPSIYKPVREELEKVEEGLLALAKGEFSPLLQPILQYKGKRMRPALTLLSGKLFKQDIQSIIPMAVAIELFHTATLVHDDIVDNSGIRRGMPTLNRLWGHRVALLLGDYLFSKAAELVSNLNNRRVIKLFAQTLMRVSAAELEQGLSPWELKKRRHHYYRWIEDKTASLFSAAAESGAILGQASKHQIKALKEYGFNLGLSFQIIDDILDFIGDEEEMGKPIGSDLLQGHLTLPVIILLEREPDSSFKETFASGNIEGLKGIAQRIAQSPLIIEECYTIARGFALQATKSIESLPFNPISSSLIDLAHYIVSRKK